MVKHDDYMTPFSAWEDVSAHIPSRAGNVETGDTGFAVWGGEDTRATTSAA